MSKIQKGFFGPTKLKDLKIDRVDLVDKGANPDAHIVLYKSEGGNPIMNFEELLKSLSEEQQELIKSELGKAAEQTKEDVAKAATEQEELLKAKDDMIAELEAKMKEKEEAMKKRDDSQEEEDIFKGLSPVLKAQFEDVQKRAAAAEAVVKALEEEKLTKQYEEVAKSFDKLPINANEVGSIFKSLAKSDQAMYNKLETLFKSFNEMVSKGDLFKELGSGKPGGTAQKPWDVIKSKADEMVTKGEGSVSKEQAIAAVLKEHPELYNDYVKGLYSEESE